MPTPKTWILAGAALALCAGAAIAAGPEDAEREASADAQTAARQGDLPPRVERREVRIYRSGAPERFEIRGDRGEHLRDILQLRPEQEPALKAFVEATTPGGLGKEHMVRLDRDTDRTTLQRLDDMQARLAEQQADAARKIAAIRSFYGQLDARQQKAFDAMPMLMMVGPSMGPMVLPGHPMRISQRMDLPPEPSKPPKPPAPPRP